MKHKYNGNEKKAKRRRDNLTLWDSGGGNWLSATICFFERCLSSGRSKLRRKFYGRVQYPVNNERKRAISGALLTGWPKLHFTYLY